MFESQGLTSPGKIPCLTGIGQEAKLPDFAEARGQKMQTKPMEELPSGQRHFLLFGAVGIILIGKSNIVLVDIEDAPISNGDPVRISSQVFDHVMYSAERLLSENYPVFLVEVLFPVKESGAVVGNFLRQRKVSGSDSLFELLEKKGFEDFFDG